MILRWPVLFAFFLVLLAGSLPAHSGGAGQEQGFAAASIRPTSATAMGFWVRTSPGRLSIVGITARQLVEYAYDLQPTRVRGGDGWTNEKRFDITAVMDETLAASEAKEGDRQRQTAQIRLMVQKLLAARFGLMTHTESVPGTVYELTLAKPLTDANHPGLKPYDAGTSVREDGSGAAGAYHVAMNNVPLSVLARRLEMSLKSPVVDKTGLSGTFDISLSWYDDTSIPADGVGLPEALRTRLDMTLTKAKIPMEMLVIDKLGQPSEN